MLDTLRELKLTRPHAIHVAVVPIMSSLAIQITGMKSVCEGMMLCFQGNEVRNASQWASESFWRA